MAEALEKTVGIYDIKAGDIIVDDIACRVVAARTSAFGEVTWFVEDGNGYHYHIERTFGQVSRLDWTEEEWDAYRAL